LKLLGNSVARLAEQIERARTREAALAIFEEFRFTPAAMMLSRDGRMIVMELVARKVKTKPD
jgi:hypothetical protein